MSEETVIEPEDKSEWGDGPWQTEPDRVEFEHAGLPCLLSRGPGGHWCGYAAVPPGHPLHGKSYETPNVLVHGGLTYASECSGHVCHIPKPGQPDNVWWFGFDCAHSGDHAPKFDRYRGREKAYDHAAAVAANTWTVDQYREVAYVRAETERLAEQLVNVVAGGNQGAMEPAVTPSASAAP